MYMCTLLLIAINLHFEGKLNPKQVPFWTHLGKVWRSRKVGQLRGAEQGRGMSTRGGAGKGAGYAGQTEEGGWLRGAEQGSRLVTRGREEKGLVL